MAKFEVGVRCGYVRAGRGSECSVQSRCCRNLRETATGLEIASVQSAWATVGAQVATEVKAEAESRLPQTLGTGLGGSKQLGSVMRKKLMAIRDPARTLLEMDSWLSKKFFDVFLPKRPCLFWY